MDHATLLFHLTPSVDDEVMSLVIDLARRQEWHVSALAAAGNVPPTYLLDAALGGGATPAHLAIELVKEADALTRRFSERCGEAGFSRMDVQVAEDDSLGALLRNGQACDFILARQGHSAAERRLIEDTVLHSARPVLVVPRVHGVPSPGCNIVVAWDGSASSARAMADALPLLKRAECVRLLACQTPVDATIPPGDLAAVARWLGRHGINAIPTIQPSMIDVGGMLLSRVAEWGADLLVMGAYGRRRWAERVFGGTTLTVLDTLTVTVLMSH